MNTLSFCQTPDLAMPPKFGVPQLSMNVFQFKELPYSKLNSMQFKCQSQMKVDELLHRMPLVISLLLADSV